MPHRRQRLSTNLTAASLLGPTAGLAMMVLSACNHPAPASDAPAADPKTGWVTLWGESDYGLSELRTVKRCDGHTLLYVTKQGNSGGVAAVPDSPECR